MASLDVAFIDGGMNIPPRQLNGGLYTGEPFKPNAPWANVPVVPDSGYLTHYNLRSANPPLDALYQFVGTQRPGNNKGVTFGVEKSSGPYNLMLVKEKPNVAATCQCVKCKLAGKYTYL